MYMHNVLMPHKL